MFLIILNVDKVVARYFDSVFLLIIIEVRFVNMAKKVELNNIDITPKTSFKIGDTIKVNAIVPPLNNTAFLSPNDLRIKGVV